MMYSNENHLIENRYMRTAVGIGAILLFCGTLHAAGNGSEGVLQNPLHSEFELMDRNQDKQLNVEEVAADEDLIKHFDKADTNQDGLIAKDEYEAYKSQVQQAQLETFLTDSKLTAQVKAELVKDQGIKSLDISVETYAGEVILSGFVENSQQVRRAIEIASSIKGVQSVKNGLIVKS